ncbi:Crp/Fnr family transcriptional regulator [Siminovitchia sediminis]|uniref:Crp/Fnr family transcriptional regulator n=1 Tax=Siminovitchia sediminis TaxID=1274353 RepID=A0ABW4KDF3_9BACI
MIRYKWEPFVKYGHKRLRCKGDTIYSQGEKGEGFYYLSEGVICIRLFSEGGKERIIDYMLEGSIFGEQGVSNEPYTVTAIADTDVVIYYFPTESLKEICSRHPEAKEIFISSQISKLRMLTETYAILNKPFEQQMAHFLIQLCKKHNSQSLPISQIALAQYIGTTRITVYKIIQKWTKKNLVLQSKQKIEVIDIPGMKALLDQ